MKYHFFLILLICSFISRSQTLSGKITDSSGTILPYAFVSVKGSRSGVTANLEGIYELKLNRAGRYTIVCQFVGYKKIEKEILLESDMKLDLVLFPRENLLSEVIIKNGEDPAYGIIRNAIKKRNYYDQELERFSCQVYTKGQLRLRDFPRKFLGQPIDFEDGDSSKKKIIFLSETFSNYSFEKGKEKVEVISSKVSGQSDGFGLAAPKIFSFYRENINFGSSINPRGFISPISDKALNYYRYKLEGTYFEDGRMIDHIRVTPKRKFEPLFNGYIDIVDLDWRIHSLDLSLFKSSSMELLDTLRIEQLYRPVNKENWFLSTQVIYPAAKFFGFDGYGSFLNVYTDLDIPPAFSKKTFTNVLLRYVDSANKRSDQYWTDNRPMPLMDDEKKDYAKKDSLEQVRKDPRYLDSLDARRNKTSLFGLVVSGKNFSFSRARSTVFFPPVIEQVNFNPAEGWVLGPSLSWTKRLDSTAGSRRYLNIISNLRYGFSNGHFNSWLTVNYHTGKKFASHFLLSAGSRVFQFNNNSPIGERGNSISCLFGENNRIRSYEASYLRGSFRKSFDEGFQVTAGFQYQDRRPLGNTTDFTFRDRKSRAYQPNYPAELLSANIQKHQVFFTQYILRWQPGVKYIDLPERRSSLGSKYPVFSLQYTKAFSGIMGSDLDYSKWKFNMVGSMNFKLLGKLRFKLGMGGFLNRDSVQIPDYDHFNGNVSTLATEYLNSFQLLPIYQFSNTASFYSLAHIEHNFNGFLTNKIPGIQKLKIYLVTGLNGFYIDRSRYYFEIFGGVDNIFKQFRVDLVQSYLNGKPWQISLRLGISRSGRIRGDDWP